MAEAIEKFERLTARYGNTALSNPSNELLNLLKNISNPEKKYRTRFLISGDEKLYTLQVEDIAYFYSENKITFAVTKEGKEPVSYTHLIMALWKESGRVSQICTRWPAHKKSMVLFRVHSQI